MDKVAEAIKTNLTKAVENHRKQVSRLASEVVNVAGQDEGRFRISLSMDSDSNIAVAVWDALRDRNDVVSFTRDADEAIFHYVNIVSKPGEWYRKYSATLHGSSLT